MFDDDDDDDDDDENSELVTCSAMFLASSGTLKPSCSRYFVSVMIHANVGSKFRTG